MKITPEKLAKALNTVRGEEAFLRNGKEWHELGYVEQLERICEAMTIIKALRVIKELELVKSELRVGGDDKK